ncbi:MAG: DUF3784 domain-containing protein [Bacteroidales bacterium]|nr:DUF3784 domain-containing protein [Bacteroidales bacterium]
MLVSVLLCTALSVFFFGSAIVIFMGKGDWMISNYRHLSEEQKARINIFRLRKVTGAMLLYIGGIMPLHMFVQNETQMNVLAIGTIFVLLGFLLLAHFWAGMPFFINPFRKK